MSDETETNTDAMAPAAELTPEERIAALEAQNASLREDLMRALAEIENVRKRGEKSAHDAGLFAIDRFARDLLPVADTLSRALGTVSSAGGDQALAAFIDGVAGTERTLQDAFTRHKLKQVGAPGDPFDPNLHQAIAQAPSPYPAGAVADVVQPGYTLAERTLRAAMVVVSLGGAPAAASPGDAPGGNVDVTA